MGENEGETVQGDLHSDADATSYQSMVVNLSDCLCFRAAAPLYQEEPRDSPWLSLACLFGIVP